LSWTQGRALVTVSERDRRGRPLRTVVCMETGIVRNDPIPGDEELAHFYAEHYRTAYKSAATPRRRQVLRNFRRAVAQIREFDDVLMPARRVLDVGAGSGEFAFLMGRLGKDVTGIEPNAAYAAWGRGELGLDIRTAHLAADLFAPGSFDLIRLNHVLEHLSDPVRYLRMIVAWLAPGGRLYVEVPNIEAYAREKSRGNMFHYGHIFNFNPWTLRAAAGLAGLEELPETAERCRDTTGAFFAPGRAWSEAEAVNPENAKQVLDLIRRHYAGEFRQGKAKKPFAKLGARIEETLTGIALGSPREIGTRLARSL
jgi:2-polyprenyl-3-methyl-5-hydroxy-6-metoxy-1,4-benzoquinol methylase